MDPKTIVGRIEQIKSSPEKLKEEDRRLCELIEKLRLTIEENINPDNIPTLLTSLGIQELSRVLQGVDYEISDFAGFARYLRGLAAKCCFTNWEPIGSIDEKRLIEACNSIWMNLFFREMVRGFLRDTIKSDKRRIPAGMMNILNGVQGQLAYIEDSTERVRGLYTQFSEEVIEPSLGVSVDAVLMAFESLRAIIPDRLELIANKTEGMRQMHELYKNSPASIRSIEEMREHLKSQAGFEKAGDDFRESLTLQSRLFVFETKDFEDCLGQNARAFLDAFSFTPGMNNKAYALPFDTSIHQSRPFARIDSGYFLVDPIYCYLSPQHRLSECFSTNRLQERLRRRRDTELEDVADRLFAKVLGTCDKYRSYYIPINENGDLAERDLLLICGGVAFAIESKARPLRDAGANIEKIEGDFKRTIQEGYDQCVSVCEYLRCGNGVVSIFDSNKPNRRVLAEIDTNKIHRVIPIVFLDAYYGFISTDLSPWLQLNKTVGYPWAVDRDALSSFTLLFSNPEKFLNFFDWRRSVYGIAHNEDELCFAGYFLYHGPQPFPKNADIVQLNQNYSDIFEEEYFRRKGYNIPKKNEFSIKPYWSEMKRDGSNITFSKNGRKKQSINTVTGKVTARNSKQKRKRNVPGRNEPCPCKSGKKYKRCCGKPG